MPDPNLLLLHHGLMDDHATICPEYCRMLMRQRGADLLMCEYLIGVQALTTATEFCTMVLSLVFSRLLKASNSSHTAGSSAGPWCAQLLPVLLKFYLALNARALVCSEHARKLVGHLF